MPTPKRVTHWHTLSVAQGNAVQIGGLLGATALAWHAGRRGAHGTRWMVASRSWHTYAAGTVGTVTASIAIPGYAWRRGVRGAPSFFVGANLWSAPLLLSESLRPGGDLRRAWRELAAQKWHVRQRKRAPAGGIAASTCVSICAWEQPRPERVELLVHNLLVGVP